MKIRLYVAACLVLTALLAGSVCPAESLTEAEKQEFALNVALPSPAEMFLAIDRMGETDWNAVADFNERYDYPDVYMRALNLGVRATNGLVAILAEDKAKLGDVIVSVITMAEELQVQDTILDRSKAFEDLANEERWDELRDELDALRYLIEMEMDQLGDRDVAVLVRTGGWLKGLHATAAVLKNGRYPETYTSILYQPTLVDYFEAELKTLEPEAQAKPVIQALFRALPEIKQLVDVGYEQPVPVKNIERLYQISSNLVKTIEKG